MISSYPQGKSLSTGSHIISFALILIHWYGKWFIRWIVQCNWSFEQAGPESWKGTNILKQLIKGRTLWGGGGGGNFGAAGIFFVIKFLVWIYFRRRHEYFLRINCCAWNFFHLIFPCMNIFFVLPPPPISFSMVCP